MNVTLPPMHIARTPREGEPRPPLQKAEITFGGKLEVSTPVAKKVLARALQAGRHRTNQEAIKELRDGHQASIGQPSGGHQAVIWRPSGSHRTRSPVL